MKVLTDHTLFARGLAWLARTVLRHRRLVLFSQAVLFVVSIWVTVKWLEFDTNRDNLVGANKKYHENFLKFKKEFPAQEDLVVVVESENPEKNRQFVERLGAKLETATILVPVRSGSKEKVETNLFADVFFKGDLSLMGNKALLFLPEENLVDLKGKLQDYSRFIQQFARTTNLVSLFNMVNRQFRTAKREQNAENDSLINALPALKRIITQATSSLHRRGTPPSPGVNALFDPSGKADQKIYRTYDNERIYLLIAHAPRSELNGPAVERLQKLMDRTKLEVPGVNAGLTGGPVLEHDEMAQSQKDTMLASIVSLVICALIFIYGYQETGRPVKATICLVVGLAYTMAFATLAVGHLNILTVTFLPMLIGLAIDFGVHLVTRYEEELRHGRSEEAALTKAMVFTGQGIFTGAFTTAGAFLAMGFTQFKGIQEMGIICGGGLVICLIPMMTLLPVLLLRGRQNVMDHRPQAEPEHRARIEQIWLSRPVLVTLVTLVTCGLALTQFRKLYFDYDLLNMQSKGLPAVAYEEKLIASTPKSVLFAVVIANSPEEAVQLEQRLQKLPAVATNGVESIGQYLTGDQTRQLAVIGEIKELLKPLRFGEPDVEPVNIPDLSRTLYSLYGYLGLSLQEVPQNEGVLRTNLISLREAINQFRIEMLQGSAVERETKSAKLAAFQRALFEDLRNTFQSLQMQDNSAPLRTQDLPKMLRDRFVGVTGKILLQVYPHKDVWQHENQREFVEQVESVYPDATGTPSQLYEYTSLLKRSYEEAALYALAAIAILVFIHFRSVGSVVLALLPVVIGSIWLCGLMGFFNIPFNPANIMTLPLMIGIGVTNGIHILNRFAEEQTPSILAKSTGKAVLISGLTTIAGFGSLMLAKHRGIESLGYVMAIGVTACMVAGLTFLPAMLNLITRRQKNKKPSADKSSSALGQEEPR